MATKKPARAHIRARVSFNGMVAGDEAEVEVSERVQGWLNAGLVEEVKAAAERVIEEARALRPIVPPTWVTEMKEARRGAHPARSGGPESDAD